MKAIALALTGALMASACSNTAKSQEKAGPPASLSGAAVKESELPTITLTEDAEKRLGLTAEASRATFASDIRRYSGEVVAPTGNSLMVTSPIAGAVEAAGFIPAVGMLVTKDQELFQIAPLNPLVGADPIAAASADLTQARARVDVARQRKALADKTLVDEVADARAREESARRRKELADKSLADELSHARAAEEVARQRKARADRALDNEVGTARAQEEAAQELGLAVSARQLTESRFERSQQDAQQELSLAGSALRLTESRYQRGQQEAQQELALAENGLAAAENRLRQIQAAPLHGGGRLVARAPRSGVLWNVFVAAGQEVSAGTALAEVVDLSSIWIKVPVYAGDARALSSSTPATIQAINGSGQTWQAHPAPEAPASGDPASSTVHLFYGLSNPGTRFKPGEKVLATITVSGIRSWIEVPWSSVVFDTNGGTWLYESLGERRYARRRVDLDHAASGTAYLTEGIAEGIPVVVQGAAELWGFEFGNRK
ncbi:MAG TPA: efflux RND transporter periplasmic adaptor subunit [Terriglobia bacterium]|nr:efflux RND transporter periplasmic adaptor subunit [Terriglobia bacterium]